MGHRIPRRSAARAWLGAAGAVGLAIAGAGGVQALTQPELDGARRPDGSLAVAWEASTGGVYRVEQGTNLVAWTNAWTDIMATGRQSRAVAMASGRGFIRLAAADLPTGRVEVTQLLDDFAWPSEADPGGEEERGYRYYGRLAADRGDMGDGLEPHSLTVTGGVLVARADTGPQGTSWVGRWHSTVHTASESAEVLDLAAPLSAIIDGSWQPRVSALYVRVRGSGTIRMELKDNANHLLKSWLVSGTWGPAFEEVRFAVADPAAYPTVKLVNLVVNSPSLLEFDEVGLKLEVPAWVYGDILRYAFATCYASLLRGYDPVSGYTRDHVHWPAGHFDSLPGCGFQALGAALAHDLGLLEFGSATQIAARSVAAIAAAPTYGGLLPHWMEHGTPKDWSTVDTGLALESALLASRILGMTNEEATLLGLVDGIDWGSLTNSLGQVAHGYRDDLGLSPYFWVNWDGEGAVVQTLRLLQDPGAPCFAMEAGQPVYGGRGFIAEIAGLLSARFAGAAGADRYGTDWRALRFGMLAAQRAYYPSNYPASLAAVAGLYGLSSFEVIDPTANTSYLAAGVGTATVPAEDGGGWIGPHYAAMAGSLDVDGAEAFLEDLRALGVLQPLIGLPEAVKVDGAASRPEAWHSAQVTLNAFFNVAGLYHAIRARDGAADVVHEASESHARFRAALDALFP